MNRPQPSARKNRNEVRQAKIPAAKDAVWEDGSGGEARARRRGDDVKGSARILVDESSVGETNGDASLSPRVTHGADAQGGTESAAVATKTRRKTAAKARVRGTVQATKTRRTRRESRRLKRT